tara:strand:+ start:9394 stop:10494 length:1101 start_codon:yes stop_codon:yes gene_type:complete
MSAKIFICPECDEVFKTRKLANQHRREKVHKGAVIVEEVVATPKTTLKSKLPKKGNYKCPKCEKTGKTLKAIKDHMSAKNHKGEPILQVIASKIPINTNKSKPKPEPKPEPQPKKPIMAFMKLRESDAKNILKPLVEINKTLEGLNITILINPINGGYILQYYHTLLDIVDDLQFKYNFVNIEMQNTDLIFCLGLLKNISKDFRVYDTAGMKMYGTQEVVEGKIVISLDERERISWGSLIEGIDFTQPDKLACVTGIWKKTYGQTKPVAKPVSKPIITPPKIKKDPVVVEKTIVQAKVEDFEDWDVTKYASETFEAYGGRHNSMGVRYSQKPYTPPAPPTPISYPVYGITEYVIVIDRVIKYEIFE